MFRSARSTSGTSNKIGSAAVTAALFVQLVVTGMLVPETAHALTIEEAQQSSHRIAAGSYHSIGLRPDNTVAAWGANGQEQCDVPPGSEIAVSVAAGFDHSLALQADGSVRAWGSLPEVPDGLDDAIALAGGIAHSLALKSDGTVVAWGSNTDGQIDVPSGLDNVVAIAAGDWHSLALKSDGTVVAWGWNFAGQCSVPAGLNDAVAIAGGGLHSLALKSNGTVVAWGRNAEQQCAVPAGLSNVVSVAAGLRHSLALKSNGTVVAWGGKTGDGKTDLSVSVPSGLADVVAIDGGDRHSLALKSDGTFVGWGENGAGQCFGVVSADPAHGAKNVPTSASITIEFSASAAAGASYGQIALRDKSGASIGITKTLSGDTLVVQPTGQLNSDQVYTLTLPENSIVDARSKGIPQYTFTFYTPDTEPPVVTSVDPPDGATDVPLDVIVRVYHDESILPGEHFDQIVLKDSDGATVECESGIGGGTYVWVRPIADLELDVHHTLTVPAGAVQDLSGNPLAEDFVSSFRTRGPLVDPPDLSTISVQHDAAGVVFDRWVTGYSTAYSGGGYVYGRWTGTELTARFTGSKIRWVGPKQPSYGMADVYIDGVRVAENVDSYAPAGSATLEAVIWESGTLTDRAHTISIRLKGNRNASSSGNVVVIDRFEVDGAAPKGGGFRIDDAAAAPGYTGSWISAINPTYYDKTYSYSRWAGHVFSVTFEGTKVAWLGPTTPFYGTAAIWLDGVYIETVDAYRSTQGWRERIWESGTLSRGTHTLEIRPTGEKHSASNSANIVIDAIDVTP